MNVFFFVLTFPLVCLFAHDAPKIDTLPAIPQIVAQQVESIQHYGGKGLYLKAEKIHKKGKDKKKAAPQPPQQLDQAQYEDYLSMMPAVLQYRQAYYELHGHVAPGTALPTSHAWPEPDIGYSYRDKLLRLLPLSNGVGAEIGPLNIPLVSKSECRILYVDHLDTEGLHQKYPTVPNIVPIDLPMVNNSLKDTLCLDAPLDFLVASQVFEHVPNPIKWLQEIASVLKVGSLLSLSVPDRRFTFDFLREETQPADIVSAYLNEAVIPDDRAIYDFSSLATIVNMGWLSNSISPETVIRGRGSISPRKVHENHLDMVYRAKGGEYLDAHCWVFTPPSFLLVMAQLAADNYIRFKCRQFYPTNPKSNDRDNHSFTIILEKVADDVSPEEIRRSFLAPLGE